MILHKIDPITRRYVDDVDVGDASLLDASSISPVFISTQIPNTIKIPRWNDTEWVDDYISFDVQENVVTDQPTVEARLSAVEAAVLDVITSE